MGNFKLFFSTLTIVVLLSIIFLRTEANLTFIIILFLLWLSLLLLSISFSKFQLIFLLVQGMVGITAVFIQPWLFYLLPLTVADFLTLKKQRRLLLFLGIGMSLLVGAYFLDSYMQLGAAAWGVFVFFLYETLERMDQEKRKLSDSSDLLRIERNHLSNLFAQSIMNSEIKEKEAVLNERQRLIHEIHDELGHKLTGGLIQMEAAKMIYQANPQQAEQLLSEAIHATRSGIDDIRKILHSQAPASETINLNRIKMELQRFTERYQIRTFFQYFGKVDRLDPLQWKILIGNLKEILTNILKYAEATEVEVHLHVYNGFLRFQVSNNGKRTADYKKGLGILGMEERTAVLEGQLLIDTSQGFTVTTILPFTAKET